jgi:hypothetical protein
MAPCVLACTQPRPVDLIANPAEGMSIAVYAKGDIAFGLIDDRRWIEITGDSIVLDHIDEAAPLPALVIEPIPGASDSALRIGTCSRERIDPSPDGLSRLAAPAREAPSTRWTGETAPRAERAATSTPVGVVSPLVRCHVTGRRGRHLVRLLYVAPVIRYRGQHDVTMTAEDKASITTRFALVTPAWKMRAEVALFDGLPGADEPAREVAHGTVVLDGGTAVLTIPTRVVAAKLRRVFDGAVRDRDMPATDLAWGKDSRRAVWVWLELEDTTLSTGPVRAHVALAGEPVRDLVVSAIDHERIGDVLRIPMWVDDTLFGVRRHWIDRTDDKTFSQRFELAVSNAGDVPREVWIEERLRPARRREITRAWPGKPAVRDGIVRSKVVVTPRGTERTGFTVAYVQ